ncbi:MAG: ThuA domain-containing protein [Planctomycetaceae bacterium]|jgi:type 1 glutamine amidotransferase|nr:ThuA domain-containing protein [Planctomycetaceae bacterium]
MKRRFFLLSALTVVCAAVLAFGAFAQEAKKDKVLFFSRSQGFEHGPVKLRPDGTTLCGEALKKYLAGKNIELAETQNGGVFDGDLSQYSGFIFYTSGNLEEEKGSKNDKAKPVSGEGLRKLIAAVNGGKGFVGIHAATDSHCRQKAADGVDLYTRFIGARFSGHGEQQTATVSVVLPAEVPYLKDAGKAITVWEEWYTNKEYNKDIHALLIQETKEMKGKDYERPPFPASWVRTEGKGRVAYSPFGHNDNYWEKTEDVRRIGELVEWSVRRFDIDTMPNIDKVTPGANELPRK